MHRLEPGDVFALDYRVERALAQGGMGAVYVALQVSTNRRRALKLMHPRLVADARLRARFEREARVGAEIPSDHVVEVVTAGVDEKTGSPYLVMELLDGEDLHAFVARRGALPRAEAAAIAAQIAHGLGAAHAAGIVHRDLKPENVFLVHEKREGGGVFVKLLDFGIAKATTDSDASHTAPVGTPLWMAPEQASAGASITPAADVWAFGLLVYWMLTGRLYWKAAAEKDVSALSVLREVAIDPLAPASARAAVQGVGQLLPDAFDRWFDRCVARDPKDRFADATEARAALGEALDTVALPSSARLALSETLPASALQCAVIDAAPSDARAHATTAPIAPTMPSGDIAQPSSEVARGASAAAAATAPRSGGGPTRAWVVGAGVAALAVIALAMSSRPASDVPGAASAPSASSLAATAVPSARAAPSAAVVPATRDQVLALVKDPDVRWKIPIDGAPRLGAREPLVTIVVFGNFQCPGSRMAARWSREVLESAPEDVALVWRDDPIALHHRATAASHLAREAAAQLGPDAFWAVSKEVAMSRKFDDASLAEIGAKVGLKPGSFETAFAERRYRTAIDRDIDIADAFGASGTPTIFVNGRRYLGPLEVEAVKELVAREIGAARALVEKGVPRSRVLEELTRGGQGPIEVAKQRLPEHLPGLSESSDFPTVMVIGIGDHADPFSRRQHQAVAGIVARREDVAMTFMEHVNPSSPESMLVAASLLQAFEQKGPEGFGAMRKLVLEQPRGMELDALVGYAREAGLDAPRLRQALRDKTHEASLLVTARSLDELGLSRVPSYLVCAWATCSSSGGYLLEGFHAERSFELLMDRAFEDARRAKAKP